MRAHSRPERRVQTIYLWLGARQPPRTSQRDTIRSCAVWLIITRMHPKHVNRTSDPLPLATVHLSTTTSRRTVTALLIKRNGPNRPPLRAPLRGKAGVPRHRRPSGTRRPPLYRKRPGGAPRQG